MPDGNIVGGPTLAVIDAVTQFFNGSQAVWNNVATPVPRGLVIYATDTTALKIGDGVTLYAELPVVFYLNSLTSLARQFRSR